MMENRTDLVLEIRRLIAEAETLASSEYLSDNSRRSVKQTIEALKLALKLAIGA